MRICIAFCETGGGLGDFKEGACYYLGRGWDVTEDSLMEEVKLCLVLGFRAARLNMIQCRRERELRKGKGGEEMWSEPEAAVGSSSPYGWEWAVWVWENLGTGGCSNQAGKS